MMDVRRIVSENRRVVWILAAALVVNVALYALVVYPLTQRVHTEQQQAGDATRDLNAARRSTTMPPGARSRARRRPTRSCRSSTGTCCRRT